MHLSLSESKKNASFSLHFGGCYDTDARPNNRVKINFLQMDLNMNQDYVNKEPPTLDIRTQ